MVTDRVEATEVLDLETWCEDALAQIQMKRRNIERWLAELASCLADVTASDPDRSEYVCQHTRLIVADGSALHCLTHMFTLLSHRPKPATAWDAELAAKADQLLQKAPSAVHVDEWRRNCQERLEYAEQRWAEWCPAYKQSAKE